MNILVCVSRFFPYKYPTAKHARRVLSYLKSNGCDITVISLGKMKRTFVDDGIQIFEYPDYKFESFKSNNLKLNKMLYRCFNYFTSHFGFEFSLDSYLLKKLGEKVIKNTKKSFDLVISFSGSFSAHEASFYLSKKLSLPLFLFYSDPFHPLYIGVKRKNALKKDGKWLNSADAVFMPKNYFQQYSQLGSASKKIIIAELAGCFSDFELSVINSAHESNDLVLYTGGFDNKYRSPDVFFSIVKHCDKNRFIVLGDKNSDISKNINYSNLVVRQRLSGEEFLIQVGEAKALYLEDNLNTSQIPFKTYEYLSTGKRIIFCTPDVNSNTTKLIKQYPNSIIINKENVDYRTIINFLESDRKSASDYERILNEYRADTIGKIVLNSINGLKNEN